MIRGDSQATQVLRLGVSGHRFLADTGPLQSALGEFLDFLLALWPGRALVAYSPLAEGADRLVARAVLQRGGKLIVPLPLAREDYCRDFATDQSQAEFARLLAQAKSVIELPPAASRHQAYRQVGEYVLENCDVLVAIWDGHGGLGQGGTGEVVARALKIHRPIGHLWAANHQPDLTRRTEVGGRQGAWRHINLPGAPPGRWLNA